MTTSDPTTPTVHRLHSDCAPQLAVIELATPDDGTWWRIVRDDAMENEFAYGLDEEPEENVATRGVVGGYEGMYLNEDLVLAWCRNHVKPPRWAWYRWTELPEDERDEDYSAFLDSSTAANRPGDDWWRGAIVELAEIATPRSDPCGGCTSAMCLVDGCRGAR